MMQMLMLIFIGGGIGSAFRYLVVEFASRVVAQVFPYGVLAVNAIGCLLAGFMIETYLTRYDVTPELRAFLMTGVLGGFTTFSAFSVDTYRLIQNDMLGLAGIYVVASIVLGVCAVYAGVYIARGMWS